MCCLGAKVNLMQYMYPTVDLIHLTLTEVTLDVLRPQTSTNRLTLPQIDICYIFKVG